MRTICEDTGRTVSAKERGKLRNRRIAWLRTRLLFEILRFVHLSVRGSRVPFKRRDEVEMLEYFRLNVDAAGIF